MNRQRLIEERDAAFKAQTEAFWAWLRARRTGRPAEEVGALGLAYEGKVRDWQDAYQRWGEAVT